MHAAACVDMPVLISFAKWGPWLDDYQASFERVLIDSGAFSVINSGKAIEVEKYAEWAERWRDRADAIAGLDDIAGDWRQGLKNYAAMPDGIGFPTFHDADPWDILPDLCAIGRERGGWIGLGMQPSQRHARHQWVAAAVSAVRASDPALNIHVWAGRRFGEVAWDSTDSTDWFRDAWHIKRGPLTKHLTHAECVEIVVKRYRRERRELLTESGQGELF